MRLKNILLVVENVEKSVAFYKELFGLQVLNDFGGNASVLYFVENNLEAFQEKLENSSFEINYLHKLKVYEWGQKAIRLYDLDGHLIEIGEMI